LDCTCAMYPDGHLVAKTEKLKHALELKHATIQVRTFVLYGTKSSLSSRS